MARLVVNREEADLVTNELTRDIVTIGRAPLNHIVIDDPSVSARSSACAICLSPVRDASLPYKIGRGHLNVDHQSHGD
jgi:hypothetical protein